MYAHVSQSVFDCDWGSLPYVRNEVMNVLQGALVGTCAGIGIGVLVLVAYLAADRYIKSGKK